MQLSIVGCPDKKRFRPFVKRAAQFYAKELISEKMLENIFVRIKFSKDLPAYGYASVEDYNESGKPREFEIELHSGIGGYDILKTLAHEMVHVKQYAKGEMKDYVRLNKVKWKGKVYNERKIDYWDTPWEIEAHGREKGLYYKFLDSQKVQNGKSKNNLR